MRRKPYFMALEVALTYALPVSSGVPHSEQQSICWLELN